MSVNPQTSIEKTVTTGKQDAMHAISKWLDEGDELDRCCACRSFGVLGDQHSVTALVDHLQDEDIDVCIDAVEALGKIGDTRAVPPLLNSLHNDPDSDIKTVVVETLGRLGGEQAISQLLELAISPPEDTEWDDEEAWDSNWDIQIEAVRALGQLRVSAAVTPLSKLLDDNDCQVDKSNLFNALAHIGGAGEQVLIQRLQEDVPHERRRAARALGINCSAIGARALGRALQDPEPEVRAAAIDALVSNGQERYLGALLLLLRDPSDEVRETALRAVNKLTSNNTAIIETDIEQEKLLPLLSDKSPQVRSAVLKILCNRMSYGQLNKESNKHIQSKIHKLLEDPNPIVVAAACPLAVMSNDPQIEQTLISLATHLQSDPAVRQQAILALGQRENNSETVLMTLTEVLNSEDAIITYAALQALLSLHLQNTLLNNESTNIADETLPTPLEIILSALRGEVISPVTVKPENTKSQPEKAKANDVATDSNEVAASEESDNISPASTLDAIALTNAELAQQIEASKTINPDETPELSSDEMETFQPYYDILDQQKYNRKKFTRKKSVNIASEVRRLSARILGECNQPEVVKALAQTIHDENPEVQREAIDALARFTSDTPGIAEIIGPLTSFLHLGNIDLRIASAKALGALGNVNTLPNLQDSLEDENLLVRNQAVLAVQQLLKSHITQSTNDTKPLAVTNKREQKKAAQLEETVKQTVEYALGKLADCLNDANAGVRKASALALSELSALLSTGNSSAELRNEIIERLVTAGFAGEGEQARDMGMALRTLDPAMAGSKLIQHLDKLSSSAKRRPAIEMLEEIFRPSQAA